MLSALAAVYCQITWPHEGGPCPSCGSVIRPPRPAGQRPWEQPVRCAACGWAGSFLHLRKNPAGPPSLAETVDEANAGRRMPPPEDTRITYHPGPPETWLVPRGGPAFLLWFALFWLTVSLTVSAGIWLTTRNDHGDWLWPRLAGGLFVVIGFVLLWMALVMKYSSTFLELGADFLTMERRSPIPGLSRRRTLRRDTITRVELREFYSVNYQPVYGLIIRSTRGRLRFGSGLSDPDKAWLESDLRAALGMGMGAAGDMSGTAVPERTAGNGLDAGVAVETRGDAVTVRYLKKRSSLVLAGLSILVVGLTPAAVVWFVMPPLPFDLLAHFVFTAAAAVIAAVGGTLLVAGFRRRGMLTILHADAAGLTLEVQRRGRSMGPPQHWRRGEVQRIQHCVAGTYNNRLLALGEIVTAGRVHLFGIGAPLEDVETMCAVLRRALHLHLDPTSPTASPPSSEP